MANVKISQLPALASLSGDDVLPVVNGNITYKVTANAIADFVGGGGGANTGNVTFDNVAVQGQGAQLFLSPDPDFTANSAYVRVRAGDVASHIHMDTGDNAIYDLFLGDDSKHVQVSSTGNIIMQSFDSGNTTAYALTLDTTGNLTLPGNTFSVNYANNTPVALGTVYGDSNVSTYLSGGTNTDGFSSTGNITLGGSGSPITLQTYSSTTTQVTLGWSPSISPAPFATGDTILVEGGSGVDGSWTVVSCTTDDVTFTCNLNPGSGAYTDLPAPTATLLYVSTVTASGNISGGNLISTGGISASGTIVASGDITSGGDVIGVTVQTANLTVNGSSSLNGNVTVTGLNSNVIRRAFGLVAADTYVTLDDLKARVTSSTSQLSLILTTGSWQGTGWTESFTGGGSAIINSWINIPLSSGFDTASLAMNSQGNGCRCVISDQTPNAKVYQITVVRSGTTGALWNISIERLV